MTPSREAKLCLIHMQVAEAYASMSKMKKRQVGAILVRDDTILSYGWNGMPAGFDDEDGETVLTSGTILTNKFVIHAEANALAKASRKGLATEGCDMYVTLSPCIDCAKLIFTSGIKRLFYKEEHKVEGIRFLCTAGLSVCKLS